MVNAMNATVGDYTGTLPALADFDQDASVQYQMVLAVISAEFDTLYDAYNDKVIGQSEFDDKGAVLVALRAAALAEYLTEAPDVVWT